MVLGKFPPGEILPENSHPSKFTPTKQPPGTSPRQIATQKILTWNIPNHFINCLSSLNISFDKCSQT